MEDENLPKDRWLDVELTPPISSMLTRYLPPVYHHDAKPLGKKKCALSVGMLVRLVSGSTPLIVTEIISHKKKIYVIAKYFTSSNSQFYRDVRDFVTFPTADEEAERLVRNADRYVDMCYGNLTYEDIDLVAQFYNTNSNQQGYTPVSNLYKTLEQPPRYGTKIAETSEGRAVLELRTATGTVIDDFAEDEIERVVAWTFLWNGIHYKAPKDSVVVGDMVSMGGHIDLVKKVNTENENARDIPTTARVVVTKPLLAPESREPVTSDEKAKMTELKDLDQLERSFAEKMVTGSRNNHMIKFALALYDRGMTYPEIKSRVTDFNKKLSNPLSEAEISATILRTIEAEE